MSRHAHGPGGPSSPYIEESPEVSSFDRAVETIESELALIAGDASRVESACGVLRQQRDDWNRPECAPHLRNLVRLSKTTPGAAKAPLILLLHEVADASEDPWPILAELLESADPEVCDRTLDYLHNLVRQSRVQMDGAFIDALARTIDLGSDLLRSTAAIEKIAALLGGPPDLHSRHLSTRRLAARVLDLSSSLPSGAVAIGLLGRALAEFLEPYFAYTRATHLDLVDLAAAGTNPDALLGALRNAEACCGEPLLRQILGELGWRALNCGLAVSVRIALTVGGSFPLLVSPVEYALLEDCPGVRKLSERLVGMAYGATTSGGQQTASAAVDRFRGYNLRHADILVDLLDVAPLTADRVRRMLGQMDEIVGDFTAIFAGHTDECDGVARVYRTLKAAIDRELSGSVPGQPLSATVTRLVQMFEDPASASDIHTMHGCKRYLHQRGLALGFKLAEGSGMTNRTVTLMLATSEAVLQALPPIEYADFESRDGQSSVPYVVRMAADAFARHLLRGERSFPKLRIFCYGNEVHCFAGFRNHPVFIRVDFSPPQRGGMIDLEYCGVSKYDLEYHPNPSLTAIETIFRRMDFDIQITNTRIHARYDKERAADLRQLSDKVEALFRLIPSLMDVDWIVGDLELNGEARNAVGAAWAEFFARWGVVPMRHVLTADHLGILTGVERDPAGERELRWDGSEPYRDLFSVDTPMDFWPGLREGLDRRGLTCVPAFSVERPVTQLTLDACVLAPLRHATDRGEIVEAPDGFTTRPSNLYRTFHEASVFAQMLASDDEKTLARSARLARLAVVLEGGLRSEVSGAVNGYEVKRAILPLAEQTLALYALSDASGIQRLALVGTGETLHERRDAPDAAWRANWSVDADAFAALLRRNNFAAAWMEPELEPPETTASTVRALFGTPNTRARSTLIPGERVLAGVKASPGRAVGLARIGLAGRRPADVEGSILIAPALSPTENPFVFRCAAIISTGGGILSHAGLLALQFRKPALVVEATLERDAAGGESLVYSRVRHREVRKRTGSYDVVEQHDSVEDDERVQEGDLLVVDADEGTLRILGQERDALALHEGLGQLAAASRSLADARADTDLLACRGRTLRARHQLEKLLTRLLDPVLARHAATELLVGEVGAGRVVAQPEKIRLLGALFRNPSVGEVARRTVEEMEERVLRRLAALTAAAAALIPASTDPAEVLSVRLDAARARELASNIDELLSWDRTVKPCGAPVTPSAATIDALATARLGALRDELVAAISCAQPPSGAAGLRHALRQLDRMDDVLDTDSAAREETARVRDRLASDDERLVRSLSDRRVLWSADGGLELWPLVGSKAANLAEAERLGEGALIPPWFVVTDRAFQDVLASPVSESAERTTTIPLRELIQRTLARSDTSSAQKSIAIGRGWETVRLPADLVSDIALAYQRLASASATAEPAAEDDDPQRPYVAVRSSSREEDVESAARAGEFDTFLFVRGEQALCDSLRRAWSGLWTERAIHNRVVLGVTGEVGGGVLVQRMVWASVSGVLHTINLADAQWREMVINAAFGLGEGIVSGKVAADQIVVSKQEHAGDLRFRYITNDKRERVVFDAGFGSGTRRVETLYHQRLRPALEYVELCDVVKVAARLEAGYRQPLDIEFAIEGTSLRLLQLRPVPAVFAVWRDTSRQHPLPGRAT
jgi:phosphohistidine swiveling domain-containing protein